MLCTAFDVPEVEVFLWFQSALGRFSFSQGLSYPLPSSLNRGLAYVYHESLDSHLHTLPAVIKASAVVASPQPPKNKEGEETTGRRKAVLFV